MNSAHPLSTQSIIVRDEQIHPGHRSACELDRVRRPNRTIPANLGESGCRPGIEGQHGSAGRDHIFVARLQFLIAGLHGLYEHLAKGECGRQQLVLALYHALPERRNLFRAPVQGGFLF